MYTIVGKYHLFGNYTTGEKYNFYRVYCTVSPSDEELKSGFVGLKTKAFNFSVDLFNQVNVGEVFKQPLFNEARLDRDKCVMYLIKE